MIIDCHTHIWNVDEHLSSIFVNDYKSVYKSGDHSLSALPAEHQKGIGGSRLGYSGGV